MSTPPTPPTALIAGLLAPLNMTHELNLWHLGNVEDKTDTNATALALLATSAAAALGRVASAERECTACLERITEAAVRQSDNLTAGHGTDASSVVHAARRYADAAARMQVATAEYTAAMYPLKVLLGLGLGD